MRLLLDTHIFLWYITGYTQLPEAIKDAIQTTDNEIFVSVVSVWEATVKWQLGKLPLPDSPERYLPERPRQHGFVALSVEEADIAHLATLPPLHKDPFDHALICQSLRHKMILATVDGAMMGYEVPILDGSAPAA